MNFTIIIPVKEINHYIRETVPFILNLLNKNWELIILPNEDELSEWQDSRIKIVSSGKCGPAKKRDLGARIATGDILVFLDDDSYPQNDLLDVANNFFLNTEVVALGGPAITPRHDSFWQKVSGAVFLSKFSGGIPERYLSLGNVKEIYDWPSVNFMVRKKDFLEIGGFNSPYWPGEDTKLCLDLIQKTSKKILYIPQMIVWHHRREGLLAHLKQIGAYGIHRGFFVKLYPQTSRKIIYFIPSFFFIFNSISLFYFIFPIIIKKLILLGWMVYATAILMAMLDILKYENIVTALSSLVYIFFTHLYYGYRFLQGLCTKKLISKLR